MHNMERDTGSLWFFLGFLILGALVVLCQNAVVELPDSRLRRGYEGDDRVRRLARMLKSPGRFDAAMRSGYTLFHLCAVGWLYRWALSLPLPAPWQQPWGRMGLALLVMLAGTFCILVFSRGIPRQVAAARGETLALTLSPLVLVFWSIFTPMAWLVDWCTRLLAPLFGAGRGDRLDNVTEEEIRMMVDVSEETGGIQEAEREMINAVFEFDDRTAQELMTHRTDVKYLDQDATLEEAVALSVQYGYSRIPVVGEDGLDDIIGILNIKDLLPLILGKPPADFALAAYLRQPKFVPESSRCRDLFAQLNTQKLQMAIVVDEYGGTSGLVTMEDILESLVGDIQDEYDNEAQEVTALDRGRYTLDGDVVLAEVERTLDWDLSLCPPDYEDYGTLGGLLIALLDRIPGPGEHPSLEIGGIRFTVEEANERQILRVLAERPEPEEEEA